MKRLLTVVLSSLCLLTLCACGQAAPEPPTTTTQIYEPPTIEVIITTTIAPTTAISPSIEPIIYPASYKDAPKAYKPVLDQFYAFAQALRREDWHTADDLSPFAWPEGYEDLAYAVKDINKDGVKELLLLTNGYPKASNVALYTLKDGEPVELGVYGAREPAQFAADGTVYVCGLGGVYTYLDSYKLETGASELTQLTAYHRNGGKFFKGPDEEQPITEEEFNTIYEQFSNPPNPMKFKFIPIEQ